MTKRILIIKKCEKCPFMKWSATGPCCDHNQSSFKEIPDFETIPKWCPLEDSSGIENNVRLLTQKLLKLEKENEAYRKMWKIIYKEDSYDHLTNEGILLNTKMGNLEKKYLGGEK